jgi:hypothetical protein
MAKPGTDKKRFDHWPDLCIKKGIFTPKVSSEIKRNKRDQ